MIYTFTFGSGHACPCGLPLGGCYTHIEGDDFGDARERMVSRWGVKWCGQYASDDEAGVERYGYTEVATNFDESRCPCGDKPVAPPALHPREQEIRAEIATLRQAQHVLSSLSRQHEVPALYSFASAISGYADLAEHALARGVDYQYDYQAASDPPPHKAIYIGEKLRQLFDGFCQSEPFKAHLLAMFLHGERVPRHVDAAEEEFMRGARRLVAAGIRPNDPPRKLRRVYDAFGHAVLLPDERETRTFRVVMLAHGNTGPSKHKVIYEQAVDADAARAKAERTLAEQGFVFEQHLECEQIGD